MGDWGGTCPPPHNFPNQRKKIQIFGDVTQKGPVFYACDFLKSLDLEVKQSSFVLDFLKSVDFNLKNGTLCMKNVFFFKQHMRSAGKVLNPGFCYDKFRCTR